MHNSYQLFLTDVTSDSGSLFRTPGVAASSTNTYYSQKMAPDREGLLGFQLETTGNLTGTFTLWYSDEERPALGTDTDWVQDTSWSPTNPAAGTTKVKYVVAGLKARWARVKYVNASGTGNLLGVVAS
jgi:hypothetical protein